MRLPKAVRVSAILISTALLAPPASAGPPAGSGPPSRSTLIPSAGARITQPLPPLSGPGASALGTVAGPSWRPLDAALLSQAKLAAATAAATAAAAAGSQRRSDFSISASPASQTVTQGSSTTYTVSTAAISGKPQTISLSVGGLPAGATGTFSPSTITAGDSSILTVTTSSATPAGPSALTITGSSPSTSHSTTVGLTVTALPPSSNDFSIVASPASQSVVQGSGTTYAVTTAVTSGSAQTISLSVGGLPTAATGTFTPSTITAGAGSTLGVTTDAATPAGTYTLAITGTGTSATHSVSVGLTVTAAASGGPSVGIGWNGEAQGALAPPDPTGAIGPSSYIELINLRYGIYDRTAGTLLNDGDLGAFTGLPVSELSDPQIVWDPGAQRWYYTVLDVARYGFAFGYSTTASPASPADFCHYILNYGYGSTRSLPDYPKMAVTNDFVLIGANVFLFSAFYNGSDLDWVKKPSSSACPSTLAGGRFAALKNADGSLTSTPVPAVNADPSSSGWVVGSVDVGTGSGSFLSVFQVTKDGSGNAVLGAARSIPVAPYSVPASAVQLGSSATLDTLDSRLEHAVAAFDPNLGQTAIWTAHAVFGGAGSEERWYEIGTAGTPALAQSGAARSPDLYVWNGAISPDRANDGSTALYGSDMVLGFNTSSSATYPAIQMVSKRGTNAQSAFVLVRQSAGPNVDFSCSPTCRWGDYSGATPDPLPSSGGRVWLSNEWNLPATNGSATVWQTWNWSATP